MSDSDDFEIETGVFTGNAISKEEKKEILSGKPGKKSVGKVESKKEELGIGYESFIEKKSSSAMPAGKNPGPPPGMNPGPPPGANSGPPPGANPGPPPGVNPGPPPGANPGPPPGADPGPPNLTRDPPSKVNSGPPPGVNPGPPPGVNPGPPSGSNPGPPPGSNQSPPPDVDSGFSVSPSAEYSEVSQPEEEIPIPPYEKSNSYFLMKPFSLIINESGIITHLKNNSEVYSYSAAWPLYGEESEGFNFLITGGFYSEVELTEEDEDPSQPPEINYFYGTSRTFKSRILTEGSLDFKRSINMQKQRYWHWIINAWDGVSNHIFAIGGQYNLNIHNSMEYYDIGQKKWILAENMNSPRTMFSVTHIHDYIYAFGGFTDSQYNFVEHNMERYSISNDTWEVLEIENKFGFLGGSVVNRTREGQILILGGINPASPNPEHKEHKLHLYTPEDNSLVELNARGLEMQTPKFFTSNGTIFNCLGESSSFRFLEYNLQYDSWGVKASEADQQKFLAQLNSLEVLEGASIYQLLATSTVISHQSFY